jgi:hypothetical protein
MCNINYQPLIFYLIDLILYILLISAMYACASQFLDNIVNLQIK